jgi:type I restriction enzyme, S subunit
VDGDVVVAQTDVTQAAEIIGRPARVVKDSRYEQLVASLDVAIVRASEDSYLSREFIYGVLQSENFTQHAHAYTSGTTVLHLSSAAIPSFGFALPPEKLVRIFDNVAESLLNRGGDNVREAETLSALRDLLLPKLMSGEIRIRDAERAVEATA